MIRYVAAPPLEADGVAVAEEEVVGVGEASVSAVGLVRSPEKK